MMKPNISPMLRGSKLVPRTSPSPAMATHASGTNVRMISQCSDRCASTPGACTTEAIGRTMIADRTPCAAPDSTLAMATSQMGHGAWTRSSISRVKPNSCAIASAIDCTPWNMTEMPITPGSRIVANADCSAGSGPRRRRLASQWIDVGQLAVQAEPAGDAKVAQERHVVAGHDQRALVGPQRTGQLPHAGHVEAVGRLVQQQQLRRRLGEQQGRQRGPEQLAARQRPGPLVGAPSPEQEPGQPGADLVDGRLRRGPGHVLYHGQVGVEYV